MELLIKCELSVNFSPCFVKKYNRLKFIWINWCIDLVCERNLMWKNWINHIRPLNINRNEFAVTVRGSIFIW